MLLVQHPIIEKRKFSIFYEKVKLHNLSKLSKLI